MRESNVEERIVESGVHQRKEQQVAEILVGLKFQVMVGAGFPGEGPVGKFGDDEDDDPCQSEAQTGKKHLAARHVLGNAKLNKAKLEEREGKAPDDGREEGKHSHPQRLLEDAAVVGAVYWVP